MREIRINQLTSIEPFSKKEGKAFPGVYVWGYDKKNVFIPLYVGKSANLFERMIQHYCMFKSGGYQLFNEAELENGEPYPNVIYEPDSLFKIVHDFPKHHKVYQNILNNMIFRIWPMPNSSEEERAMAESLLADKIGRKRLITRVNKSQENSFERNANIMLKGSLLIKKDDK